MCVCVCVCVCVLVFVCLCVSVSVSVCARARAYLRASMCVFFPFSLSFFFFFFFSCLIHSCGRILVDTFQSGNNPSWNCKLFKIEIIPTPAHTVCAICDQRTGCDIPCRCCTDTTAWNLSGAGTSGRGHYGIELQSGLSK